MSVVSASLHTIQEKVQLLSPQKVEEVLDFIEFLLRKDDEREPEETNEHSEQPLSQTRPRSRNMIFDWADGPDDPPEPYTSVELQHKANEWRNDDEIAD